MVGVRGSIPLAPTIPGPSTASFGVGDRRVTAAPRSSPPQRNRRIASLSLRTTAFTDAKRSKAGRALLSAVVGLALLAAAAGRVEAADSQGAIKDKHGDWVTRCETPPGAQHEQCAIVLSVVDQERPNLILVVIVLNTADRKARLMRVIAPLGVLLPPGVSLRIDEADAGRLNFLQCLPNGCVAQLAMDDALIDKLKNGKTATLGIFQTPEQGVGVQAPLAGFKEGYEQLP
jgi:invasion protein IalB